MCEPNDKKNWCPKLKIAIKEHSFYSIAFYFVGKSCYDAYKYVRREIDESYTNTIIQKQTCTLYNTHVALFLSVAFSALAENNYK